jgi:tetratricopeptide (TPR) repeat protein
MTRASHLLRAVFLATLFSTVLAGDVWPATDRWIEVKSPHFVVNSNASEKEARRIAEQFEIFRAVFQKALPKLRVDPGQPLIIVAAKNEGTLKLLMPQFWAKKGSVHPTGYFVPGQDKHYVTLRLDTEGDNPYQVVYHEYVHLLVNLNFTFIPTWLNEGLAEFYANASISSKDVGLGRPSQAHLALLQERKLLPLDVLLKVDNNSPQYNEADTASVFYAESWALVHYMMLDNKTGHTKDLAEYISLVQQGTEPKEAFQKLFGKIKDFEFKLERYTEQESFYYVHLKVPTSVDVTAFTVRDLTPAEAAAVRGDFQVHMDLPAEAKASLAEAMQLDPKLVGPHESMGMLAFRQGNREEALKWFGEAVQLDSKNFLAHYFYAFLASQEGAPTSDRIAVAEQGLRKAIELNPNFAPAFSALAQFYVLRHEHLDEALTLARQATQLEPGMLTHHLAVANVLMAQGKYDEAQKLTQRVLEAAKTPQDRAAASQMLQSMQTYVARMEELKQYRERIEEQHAAQVKATEGTEGAPKLNRRPGSAGSESSAAGNSPAATTSQPAATPSPEPAPAPEPRRQTAPAEGRVAVLTCKGKTLDLTLDYYGHKISLHAEDYSKIEFPASAQLPKNFDPCISLKGRNVKAEFLPAKGKPYAGDIVQIEVGK